MFEPVITSSLLSPIIHTNFHIPLRFQVIRTVTILTKRLYKKRLKPLFHKGFRRFLFLFVVKESATNQKEIVVGFDASVDRATAEDHEDTATLVNQ